MRTLCCVLALATIVVANPFAAQPRAEADLDWWKTAVLYQIYPRSFKDSDGDGVGDLNGITEKLDHLKDIGAAGVWLSPIFKSPMADFGYDISDFTDIDSRFGKMEDFDELSKKAKTLGLKVIFDFVPNHSSDEHEWFLKSVNKEENYTDYYVWHKGTQNGNKRLPPNNWESVFGGPAWTLHPKRDEYYLHQFDPKQPDLNYRNPVVVEEMKGVLRFWLGKGVDGFRVDAIPHLFEPSADDRPANETSAPTHLDETYEMVAQWRKLMDEETKKDNRTRLLMLEAYGTLDQTMRYYGTANATGGHFPFNFRFITDVHYPNSTAAEISKTINDYLGRITENLTANWVLGNHDQHRVASRFLPELVDGMNFIGQLLPGVAVTYNGEEIGMENTFIKFEDCVDPQGVNAGEEGYLEKTRDLERTPFQWDNSTSAGFSTNEKTWLPVNENYKKLNLNAQKEAEKSHYKVYKQLTNLRQKAAIQRGDTTVTALADRVLGFTRTLDDEDSYLVVVNFANDTQVVNVKEKFQGIPDSITMHILSINSGHMANHSMSASELQVGALESYVFVYQKESSFGNIILPSSLFVFVLLFVAVYV